MITTFEQIEVPRRKIVITDGVATVVDRYGRDFEMPPQRELENCKRLLLEAQQRLNDTTRQVDEMCDDDLYFVAFFDVLHVRPCAVVKRTPKRICVAPSFSDPGWRDKKYQRTIDRAAIEAGELVRPRRPSFHVQIGWAIRPRLENQRADQQRDTTDCQSKIDRWLEQMATAGIAVSRNSEDANE